MKFLKQSQLNFRNVKDLNVAVTVDGGPANPISPRVTMADNTNSLQLPVGTVAQRPDLAINGFIRYNSELDEVEVRQGNQWRTLRYKEATNIVIQPLGLGDAIEVYFGPLNPAPAMAISAPGGVSTVESGATWGPQNILVFVENVPQLSDPVNSNYSIVQNPTGKTPGWYVHFHAEPVPYGKPVTVIHGFDR